MLRDGRHYCGIPGCNTQIGGGNARLSYARGLCKKHYDEADSLNMVCHAIIKTFPGSVCESFGLTLYTRDEYDARSGAS